MLAPRLLLLSRRSSSSVASLVAAASSQLSMRASTGTRSASDSSRRRRRRISGGGRGSVQQLQHGWTSQPRRGMAAAANPIKAKITGSLLEARDTGAPVQVGMEVELEHTFGPEAVATFAALSGDDNPIHLDPLYATKQGIFKGAIVHGLLVGSLFGTIFGVTFPGCVYLQQSFKFSRPVYVGRPVTAVVEVTRRREREGSSPPSSILFCSTHVIDEEGVAAIAGEAVVMLVGKEKGDEGAGGK